MRSKRNFLTNNFSQSPLAVLHGLPILSITCQQDKYLLTGQNKKRIDFSHKLNIIFERNLNYSNTVLTKLFAIVSPRVNSKAFSLFAILRHVGDILVEEKLQQKCCRVGFIGQRFSRMHMNLAEVVCDVSKQEIYPRRI